MRAVSEDKDGNIFQIAGPIRECEDLYYWWLLGLSQGAHQYWNPWVWISTSMPEQRLPLVQWEMKHENYLAGLRSAAETAVLISTRNNNLIAKPTGRVNRQNAYLAVCSTLTLAHLPYKAIVDKDLETSELNKKAKTIILMGVGILSDAQVGVIRQFVKQGGTLIASAETALYKEDGSRRPDFALADVFGCHYRGVTGAGGKLVFNTEHPLLSGAAGTIDHPDESLVVEPTGSVSVVGRLRRPKTPDLPALMVNRYGKGQAIYLRRPP